MACDIKILDWIKNDLTLYVKTESEDWHYANKQEADEMRKRGIMCLNYLGDPS